MDAAAPPGVGLEAEGVGQVGAGEAVPAGHHPADAARHLAAQSDAAVAVCKVVRFDQDVPAGKVRLPAVPVPPRLEADAVVAGVEAAVLDPDALAALGVAAVVVGAVAGQGHPVHRDALALHRVELPHGAVFQGDALQQHPPAADELDEVGPQPPSLSEKALAHRDALLVHPAQGRPGGGLQVGSVVRPGLFDLVVPVPPVLGVRPAVQHAGAGDGDVGGVAGVEQGAVVVAGGGLPVGVDQGVIPLRVLGGEAEPRLGGGKAQLDPVLQPQRAGRVDAGAQFQHAAPRRAEGVDGLLQLFGL